MLGIKIMGFSSVFVFFILLIGCVLFVSRSKSENYSPYRRAYIKRVFSILFFANGLLCLGVVILSLKPDLSDKLSQLLLSITFDINYINFLYIILPVLLFGFFGFLLGRNSSGR